MKTHPLPHRTHGDQTQLPYICRTSCRAFTPIPNGGRLEKHPRMKAELEYNTQRPALVIPEYGRHVQRMVDLCMEEEDRAKRTEMAHAIVRTIGRLNPQLLSGEDAAQTIWDHLHVIADYKLDVDSPYPVPSPEVRTSKPRPVAYPQSPMGPGHYGKLTMRMVEACIAMDDGPEKEAFTLAIANQMKKQFLVWNRDHVDDAAILKDLHEASKGRLQLKPDQRLISTEAILQGQRNGPKNAATPTRKRRSSKKGRRNRRKKR